MLAQTVRSGLIEAEHEGAVAVIEVTDGSRRVVATHGDADRKYFFRSAIKPVQATVSQSLGARLRPEQLAVASSSHSGHPIHIAYVRAMLADVGLDESVLACPPARPLSPEADRLWASRGLVEARRVLHNCSGKHAAMLRACVAQGWPIEGYVESEHPLQQAIGEQMASVAGLDAGPTGIDGCGLPTFRGSTATLAAIFATISHDDSYAEVATAVRRYPSLVGGNLRPDGKLGAWFPGPMKVGAEGCFGAGVRGTGLAVKAFSGSSAAAAVGMAAALDAVGMLSDAARRGLDTVMRAPVFGGGRPVGSLEPAFDLAT